MQIIESTSITLERNFFKLQLKEKRSFSNVFSQILAYPNLT